MNPDRGVHARRGDPSCSKLWASPRFWTFRAQFGIVSRSSLMPSSTFEETQAASFSFEDYCTIVQTSWQGELPDCDDPSC